MTEREATELAFDVDAALLVELGERLVARRSTALAELIKNAYDADATDAIVSLEDVTSPSGEIVVVDDGSGMTLEAMKRGWMRIATTHATVNSRSVRFGRPRTGAKGLGRFACGRLASRLSLESVSRVPGGSERIDATFDWHDFIPGRDLSEIKATITREFLEDELPTGTSLRLTGLPDTWTRKDIAALQAELDDLTNFDEHSGYVRRGSDTEDDPGFRVQILAPEFPDFEGSVGRPFKDAAWGVLEGRVTTEGVPQYELDIRDIPNTLYHQPPQRLFRDLVEVSFTVRMMIYQGSRFRESGYSLAEARHLGRERGGVRVYLDGFQVFSYGSPGDDWLDLDKDRARRLVDLPNWLADEANGVARPMLLLPGNMQLFGSVAISRELNPGLSVSISRERLVQNDSFTQLKAFVRSGIDWMTVCYAREKARQRSITESEDDTTETAEDSLQSVRAIVIRDEVLPDDTKSGICALLDEADSRLARQSDARVSELSMLRVLASAGTTVLVFEHTLRAMAGQLDRIVHRLESNVSFLPIAQRDDSEQAIQDLRSWSSMATGQGALVGLLVGADARTRRKSLVLRPLVEHLSQAFAGYMGRFGIVFENDVPPRARTPALYEAELYAVLLNLFTNSFKAVRDSPERRVRVECPATAGKFILRVHDTGVGIPSGDRGAVFEPFVTTSQPDPVLGVGTGLGLKIVRDFAVAWGGTARVIDSCAPWSTTIEVVAPKSGLVPAKKGTQ